MLNHVFHTYIFAYCQQNRYVGYAIYTDLFTLNILHIAQENTCKICKIVKNTSSEKQKRMAASMGRLFRKVFQMQSSWYSSRLKAVINHVPKYKKPGLY